MKKLLLSGFLAFLFLSPTLAIGGEKPLAIRLVITKTTTADDLQKQQEFMEANGYSLVIDHVEYNEDGGVSAIKGKVDFGKSSGAFSNDNIGENCIVIKKSLFGGMSIKMNGKP